MWLSWYFPITFLLWPSVVHCDDPPKLLKDIKRNYTARVGGSVKLKCVVSGTKNKAHLRTLTAWKKFDPTGKKFVKPSWQRFTTKLGRYLKISNIQAEDAGTYICIATNPFGSLNEAMHLDVVASNSSSSTAVSPIPSTTFEVPSHSAPIFRKTWPENHRTFSQYEGESLRLKCQASGDPRPAITWTKNGRRLSKVQRSYRTSGGAVLSFQVLLPSDAGRYACSVANSLGSINRTFVVRVLTAPTITPPSSDRPEVIRDRLQNKTVVEGDVVTFVCATTSFDEPDYGWLKWDSEWNPVNLTKRHPNPTRVKPIKGKITFINEVDRRNPNAVGVYTQKLRIANASLSDAGKYTCHVRHSGGFASGSVFLAVQPKAVFEPGDPEPDNGSTAEPKAVRRKNSHTRIPLVVFIAIPLAVVVVSCVVIIFFVVQIRRHRLQMQLRRKGAQPTSSGTQSGPTPKWCVDHRQESNTYLKHPQDIQIDLENDSSVGTTARCDGFDELIPHRTPTEGLHSENRCCQHSSCAEQSSESLSTESRATSV